MGMDFVEVVMAIEDEFSIDLPDDIMSDFVGERSDFTVGSLYDFICEELQRLGRPVPTDGWVRMQRRLSKVLGVREPDVRREAMFIRDLGAS